MPDAQRKEVFQTVVENFHQSESVDPKKISDKYSISVDTARDLLIALAFMVGIVSERDSPPGNFIDEAIERELLSRENAAVIAPLAEEIFAGRASIRDLIEQQRLGSEVLPSLAAFDVTVDLRLKFEGDKVGRFLPMAILHIDTDADRQEVWLQLNRAEISRIIGSLQEALKSIDAAEAWAKRQKEEK